MKIVWLSLLYTLNVVNASLEMMEATAIWRLFASDLSCEIELNLIWKTMTKLEQIYYFRLFFMYFKEEQIKLQC